MWVCECVVNIWHCGCTCAVIVFRKYFLVMPLCCVLLLDGSTLWVYNNQPSLTLFILHRRGDVSPSIRSLVQVNHAVFAVPTILMLFRISDTPVRLIPRNALGRQSERLWGEQLGYGGASIVSWGAMRDI